MSDVAYMILAQFDKAIHVQQQSALYVPTLFDPGEVHGYWKCSPPTVGRPYTED